MPSNATRTDSVAAACRLLFGDETPVCPEFLDYMQLQGLKVAYRQHAFDSHPDRAAALGIEVTALVERFSAVRDAYELLLPYVNGEKIYAPDSVRASKVVRRPYREPSPAPRPKPEAEDKPDLFWPGHLPARVLRLGQFLYYRRQVGWNALLAALAWQRRKRPPLASFALKQNWLASEDLSRIRRHYRHGERWGETAIRIGLLTERQLKVLLGMQRMSGYPIGRYFVESGLLDEPEILLAVREAHNHNFHIRCRKKPRKRQAG